MTQAVVKGGLVLQSLRLVMAIIDLAVKTTGVSNSSTGFTPTLLLVDILEQGQGAFLLVVTFPVLRALVKPYLTMAQERGMLPRDPETNPLSHSVLAASRSG